MGHLERGDGALRAEHWGSYFSLDSSSGTGPHGQHEPHLKPPPPFFPQFSYRYFLTYQAQTQTYTHSNSHTYTHAHTYKHTRARALIHTLDYILISKMII